MPLIRLLTALALALLATFPAAAAGKAAGPSIVFDPATGAVLSQDRAGEPWYPASLTKLMTAYVVFHKLKAGTLKLEQDIPVSAEASAQPPSKIGIKPGGKVTVDFALQALLVYSANDMAYVLADAAGGSVAAFVVEMNRSAKQLGMSGSRFANPNGLFEPRNVSTARDIAILASALLREFPEHAHYFSQPALAVGKRKLANRNSLLRQMENADGMKTGFVCNSGYNLVATATLNGRKLGAVVLGASSGKHRTDLAEMLLVDGFSRTQAGETKSLRTIPNMEQGAIVPADMTGAVCRQKPPVEPVAAQATSGWGLSFGTFDSALKADMALRGRLLAPASHDFMGPAGVLKMPGDAGFAAVVWSLDQATSLAACAKYRASRAPCDVLTPETFAQISALSPPPQPKAPATAQGSDGNKNKKKKRKK